MYLLNQFNKKSNKTNKTIAVTSIGVTGLAGKYLIDKKLELNANKKAYQTSVKLYTKGKAATRLYHPDRLAGQSVDEELKNIYESKFRQGVREKKLGKLGMDALESYANRTYKDAIKSDVTKVGNTIKSTTSKGLSLLKSNKSKVALGLVGISGVIAANKIRKARNDKGKLRGRYRK